MSLRSDPSIGFALKYSQPPHNSPEEYKSRSEHRLNYLKFLRVLQPDGEILFAATPDEFVPINWKPMDGSNTTPVDDAWFPFGYFQIGYANITQPAVSPGARYVHDQRNNPQRPFELYEPNRGQGRVLTLLSLRNTVVASAHLALHSMPHTQSMDMIICGFNLDNHAIIWACNPARKEDFLAGGMEEWVSREEMTAKVLAVKPQLLRAYFSLINQGGSNTGGPI